MRHDAQHVAIHFRCVTLWWYSTQYSVEYSRVMILREKSEVKHGNEIGEIFSSSVRVKNGAAACIYPETADHAN